MGEKKKDSRMQQGQKRKASSASPSKQAEKKRKVEDPLPPGLVYSPNFITEEESKSLVKWINEQTWSTKIQRKTQHYGYEYAYTKKKVDPEYLGALPEEFDFVVERAKEKGLITQTMTQLIINDYEEGQGIAKHTDSPNFGPEIFCVSLLSNCVMNFRKKDAEKIDVLLEKNSAVVMTGESRTLWTHEISKSKSYTWKGKRCPRAHRISLTFRNLAEQAKKAENEGKVENKKKPEKKVEPAKKTKKEGKASK